MKKYTVEKKVFDKKEVKSIDVFLDNGSYFEVDERKLKEVEEISLKLYDKLYCEKDYCPVAESGCIKIKVAKKTRAAFEKLICGEKRDNPDRENGKPPIGIKCIRLFDENNWNFTIYGNIVSETAEGSLTFRFIPKAIAEPADSAEHFIYLNDVTLSTIDNIKLDFENCDSFTIYDSEIIEIHLEMDEKLKWGSCDYSRKLKGGYIEIKLRKDITWRDIGVFFQSSEEKITLKTLKRRLLCYHKKAGTHDLCHLYIQYNYEDFASRVECIDIDDIRSEEELERLYELEEEGEGYVDFVGGYSKKLDDGAIGVAFGKDAKKRLRTLKFTSEK